MSPLFVTVLLAVAAMANAEAPVCTTQTIGFLNGKPVGKDEIIPAYQPSGRTDLRICTDGLVVNGAIVTACDCDSYPTVKLFNNDYDVEYGDIYRTGAFKCVASVHKTVFCVAPSNSQSNARAQAVGAGGAAILPAVN